MQEPSKGDKINEGIMKELTGGDPVQCRALYSSSKTFIPQFKLAVCTNNLFDITSNDDGTWRNCRHKTNGIETGSYPESAHWPERSLSLWQWEKI